MYSFVSLERIISFFLKFGIDITVFTQFELSILIILSNIFMVIFYLFLIYVTYKLILKVLDWWF